MRFLRRLFKMIFSLVTIVILLAVGVVGWLTLTEYQPADVEIVTAVAGARHDTAQTGKLYRIVSLNVGYGALGATEDFVMDGGRGVLPKNKAEVQGNLNELLTALLLKTPDICFLQEVDTGSNRSFYINEADHFTRGMQMGSAFALNFKCGFVPFPWPPLGKVESGVLTLNNLAVTEATRESLPVPFSWPKRVANLKRCLLVERVPMTGGKELVLVNLHLEAYTTQDGRAAQMRQLAQLLKAEALKGNYVVAGGDFNQSFPGALEKYPLPADAVWQPGQLADSDIPEGFSYAFDMSTPTCRSLQEPYDGDRKSLVAYVIDGFIVSANVKVNAVETFDLNFRNTDHQPVVMEFTLQ